MRRATAVLLIVAASSRCGPSPAVSGRKAEIRRVIAKNLHFHIHCWCLAPDERTVAAVLAVAKDEDTAVLAELLSDPNDSVALGARGTLIALAAADLAKSRRGVPRDHWLDHDVLEKTSIPSVRALQQVESGSPDTRSRAIATDALIEIGISERNWRESHAPPDQNE